MQWLHLQRMEEFHNTHGGEGASLFLTKELRKLCMIKTTPQVRQETTANSILRGMPNSSHNSRLLLLATIFPTQGKELHAEECEEWWRWLGGGWGEDKGEPESAQGIGHPRFQRSFYSYDLNFQARRQQLYCVVPWGQLGLRPKSAMRFSKFQ